MRGYNRTSNTDINPPPPRTGGGIRGKLSNMMNLNNNNASSQRQQQRSRSTSRGRRMSLPSTTLPRGIRSNSVDNKNNGSGINGGGWGVDERKGDGLTPRSSRKDKLMTNYDEYNRRDSDSDGTDIVPPGAAAFGQQQNQNGGKKFTIRKPNLSMPRVRRSNNTTNNNEEVQQQEMIVPHPQEQEEFQNSRLQYFNEHSSPSPNPNPNYKNYHYNNNKHSNWILPPNYKLSPRIDIWCLLAISSCCAVASIGSIHSSLGKSTATNSGMGMVGSGMGFSSNEIFALSTSAISFILSFVMAIGLRYAPLRSALTSNIYPPERSVHPHDDGGGSRRRRNKRQCLSTQGQIILSSFNITYELLVLTLLGIFWMASMGIICNDASYYNGGGMVSFVSDFQRFVPCFLCLGGWGGGHIL